MSFFFPGGWPVVGDGGCRRWRMITERRDGELEVIDDKNVGFMKVWIFFFQVSFVNFGFLFFIFCFRWWLAV